MHRRAWNRFVQGHHRRTEGYKTGYNRGKTSPRKGQITWHDYVCKQCGKEGSSRTRNRSYCSQRCGHLYRVGDKSPMWRGGKTPDGYLRDKSGYQREHRVTMRRVLKRPFALGEVVHHIDQDRTNNDLANLFLFHCDRCHMHFHGKMGKVHLQYIYYHLHDGDGPKFKIPARKRSARALGDWSSPAK